MKRRSNLTTILILLLCILALSGRTKSNREPFTEESLANSSVIHARKFKRIEFVAVKNKTTGTIRHIWSFGKDQPPLLDNQGGLIIYKKIE